MWSRAEYFALRAWPPVGSEVRLPNTMKCACLQLISSSLKRVNRRNTLALSSKSAKDSNSARGLLGAGIGEGSPINRSLDRERLYVLSSGRSTISPLWSNSPVSEWRTITR